jgi:hypothetical protein
MANKKDKSIRRNSFNQIISYTTSSGLYGRIEFKPETSAFKTDDYNRVIGEVSDKMLDKLPDTEPEIVSNNWLDETDLLDSSTTPMASLWLSDSAVSNKLSPLDQYEHYGPYSPMAIWNGKPEWMLIGDMYVGTHGDDRDHVFDPKHNKDENGQRVYYHWPLRVGVGLWTDTAMSQPLESTYITGTQGFSYFLVEAIATDTDLKNKLSNAYKNFFKDVHTSIVNNDAQGATSPWRVHIPTNSEMAPFANDRVARMKNTYSNKQFMGCCIKAGKDTHGNTVVKEIWKLVGNFKGRTTSTDTNSPLELPHWHGGTIGI